MAKKIVLASLPIVFAAKTIILRVCRASPVQSWLFLELAARSRYYCSETHHQVQLANTTPAYMCFKDAVKFFLYFEIGYSTVRV
jgi:hypothetical protein